MLKTIELIKNNIGWRDILVNKPYCLRINDDDGFTILKYSQAESDFFNEIVRECRGLIIDKDLNPVCIPFFMFTEYKEKYADKIDWNSAIVEEKMDGTLLKLWNYKGKWIVSTNDTIFAKNVSILSDEAKKNNIEIFNYEDLFNLALNNDKVDMKRLNHHYTYMFEVVSPYNQVVIPYKHIAIYHIGTRNNASFEEYDNDIGIRKPKSFKCNDINEVIKKASTLKAMEEGYIVKDKYYNRIKVKNPAYVTASNQIDYF